MYVCGWLNEEEVCVCEWYFRKEQEIPCVVQVENEWDWKWLQEIVPGWCFGGQTAKCRTIASSGLTMRASLMGSAMVILNCHNFWSVCQILDFHLSLESSWNVESNGPHILLIKRLKVEPKQKWFYLNQKLFPCV